MNAQFARLSPGRSGQSISHEPHAALLIDFDNVTMGIRSDITKELKNLLNSAIIKGKVAVQRAYADWRRYPQYVVPLAEASIDLIFAPAYGSSKKNATDIRLAIDALELVFTRPEIGTFILLSGDSDFSSLVLKLKEYGKYVVGVGIRESASDLLVQNCDEYYSYSALTGLTRAGDEDHAVSADPWELVDIAVRQMVAAGDVMRSDRLKQVLLELDSNFDEKELGFSKFNRFVAEAANRGVLHLQKMENGQFEIALADGDTAPAVAKSERTRGRGRRREERPAAEKKPIDRREPTEPERPAAEKKPIDRHERTEPAPRPDAQPVRTDGAAPKSGLPGAYDLLRRAARELGGTPERAVRDSDVKRRMLDLDPEFDESTFGFSKFSRFLRQAHDAEFINLRKIDNGNYELTLPDGTVPREPAQADEQADGPPPSHEARHEEQPRDESREERGRGRRGRRGGRREDSRERDQPSAQRAETAQAEEGTPRPSAAAKAVDGRPAIREDVPQGRSPAPQSPPPAVSRPGASTVIGLRRGSRGGRLGGPPPLLEGQAVGPRAPVSPPAPPSSEPQRTTPFAAPDLGLPVRKDAVIEYLTKAYKGIGRKSAETLIDAVGASNVFAALESDPDRVREVLGDRRGTTLLDAWAEDFARRSGGGRRGNRASVPEAAKTAAQTPVPTAPPPGPAANIDSVASDGAKPRRPRGRRGGRKRNPKAKAESKDA